MYEQSARWNEYYREPEPRRRKEQLDILCMTEPDDGANEYRRMLFKARHVDEKQPGHEVDRFLFNCLSFAQLWASAKLFKKHAKKEALQALSDMMGADYIMIYDQNGKEVLSNSKYVDMELGRTQESSTYELQA